MKNDFNFNVTLLKYFWDNRDRDIIKKETGIMKQKFLFFYNVFAKINSKDYTLKSLKAFEHGPVYYDIYKQASKGRYLEQLPVVKENIDEEIAQVVLTLMYLYINNIGTVTHTLDIWKNHYGKDVSNDIPENGLSDKDEKILRALYENAKDVYENYTVWFNKHHIPMVFRKGDKNRIVNSYYDKIQAYHTADKTPVYVTEEDNEVYFD